MVTIESPSDQPQPAEITPAGVPSAPPIPRTSPEGRTDGAQADVVVTDGPDVTARRDGDPTDGDAADGGPAAPRRRLPHWVGVGTWRVAEVLTSLAAAAVMVAWSTNIRVDPFERIGQVSALAALQFRFALVGLGIVVLLLLAHRFLRARWRDLVVRLGCAAVAGITTGIVSGGIVVALTGTPWGLWAGGGDFWFILDYTELIKQGREFPTHYPPLVLYILDAWTDIKPQPLEYAVRDVQIIGTALFGPAAYLAWRLVLPPLWALGIGVVAMLPFIEPVKTYPQITLVMMIPVLVALLRRVRRADTMSLPRSAVTGVLYGVVLGLLFLLYSGWYVWTAAGIVAAFLLLAPWRRGWAQALVIAATATAAFVAVGWQHLTGLLGPTGGKSDNFFYHDTNTEPAYFAMWRNDRPADIKNSPWPPLGELGGVGVFTIVLFLGLAVALWLGWRRTVVVTLVCCVASAWFMRMYLAAGQWDTMTVRLYPRTTMVLLYALLLLTGFAVMFAMREIRDRMGPDRRPVPVAVMLVPLLFLLSSAASATSDRYMPRKDVKDSGFFSYIAQMMPTLGERVCPTYGARHGCDPSLPPGKTRADMAEEARQKAARKAAAATPTPAPPTPNPAGS